MWMEVYRFWSVWSSNPVFKYLALKTENIWLLFWCPTEKKDKSSKKKTYGSPTLGLYRFKINVRIGACDTVRVRFRVKARIATFLCARQHKNKLCLLTK